MAGQGESHRCDCSKQLSFLSRLGHGSMVSFINASQLFHDSNGCWVPLELTFIASAVITRMRMRCYGHMAHGTSSLYTSVRSLHNLHSLGPLALGCVNSVVYNLHVCNSTYKIVWSVYSSRKILIYL